MINIKTIFAQDKTLSKLNENEFEIFEENEVESINQEEFKIICQNTKKHSVLILDLPIDESYTDIICVFSKIAKENNLLFVLISNEFRGNKLKLFNAGLFELVTNDIELDILISKLKIMSNLFSTKPGLELNKIRLTNSEQEIFNILKQNLNNVVSYLEIKNSYSEENYEYVFDDELKSIKSLVYKIKKKLEKTEYQIINIKGKGYKMTYKTK